MSQDPRFDPYGPPTKQTSGCAKWAIGCGIVALVAVLILAAAAVYVARNFKQLATDAVSGVLVKVIEDSDLPEDQKRRVIARVRALQEGYKSGEITDEQMQRVVERLTESPLMAVASIEFFERQYIEPSALEPEEKVQARRTLQRFGRGVFEQRIAQNAVNEVLDPISTVDAEGNRQLNQNPTTAELREALARAKAKADEAAIPDEPFEVNVADELDRTIDEALRGEPQRRPGEELKAEKEDPAADVSPIPVGDGT